MLYAMPPETPPPPRSRGYLQTILLALLPLGIAGLFNWSFPELVRNALRHPLAPKAIGAMVLWYAIGLVVTRFLVKPGDPWGQHKMLLPMLVFFFPVNIAIMLGPVILEFVRMTK
jgi:hypothetical protein